MPLPAVSISPVIEPLQPTPFTQAPVSSLPVAPQVPTQPGSSPSAPAPSSSGDGGGEGGFVTPVQTPGPVDAPVSTQNSWIVPAAIAGGVLLFMMSRR